MREVTCQTVEQYLVDTGRIARGSKCSASRLPGGVSNEVLLLETDQPGLERFVLKQARARLRTPQEWLCTIERIWREVAVLRICQRFAADNVPLVLFEDRDAYLFAMTAAPAGHTVWKEDLLRGEFDIDIAEQAGRLLAALHSGGWGSAELEQQIGDRSIFRQLRIEPYYETVAQTCPDVRASLEQLTDNVWNHRLTLVHADFSPKNLLVYQQRLWLVDFETGHYGDPAFDLGFFLAHLVLKAVLHAPRSEPLLRLGERFLQSYDDGLDRRIGGDDRRRLWQRGAANLGGCLLARLDGKSQVEYLEDDSRRSIARQLARQMLELELSDWREILTCLRERIASERIFLV